MPVESFQFFLVADVLEEVDDLRTRFYLPVTADLHGAAVAIVRLQDVYKLDMEKLGQGIIPGSVTHSGEGEYHS